MNPGGTIHARQDSTVLCEAPAVCFDSQVANERGVAPVNDRKPALPAAIFVGLFLCIALPFGLLLNIWIDEYYSLIASSGTAAEVWDKVQNVEWQPPLFYYLLWIWMGINDSVPFLRLFSIIAVAAGLWVAHLAARSWFPGISSAWLVAPLAVNAFVLYAATEIRTYSLVFLFSALLIWFFHDGFLTDRPRRSFQIGFAVTALMSLYTFYYLGFILAGGGAALLVERKWRRLAEYVGLMTVVGLLFLPQALLVLGHTEVVTVETAARPSIVRSLEFAGARILSTAFGFFLLPSMVRWPIIGLTGVAVLASLWLNRSRVTAETRALWAIVAVVVGFYALAVWFQGEIDSIRHFTVGAVPMVFALAAIACLYIKEQRRALLVFAAATFGVSCVASFQMFKPLAKGGDFTRAAQYLEDNEGPGEPIVVLAAYAALPLDYYYEGVNTLVPLPEPYVYEEYDSDKWRLESEEAVRARIASTPSEDGYIWVYTVYRPNEEINWADVDMHFDYLENVLAKDYELDRQADFFGASVRAYKRKG